MVYINKILRTVSDKKTNVEKNGTHAKLTCSAKTNTIHDFIHNFTSAFCPCHNATI